MQEFRRQYVDVAKLPPNVLEKWSASALLEGFVPFPKKLLRSMCRLFTGENAQKQLAVILAIADFKRPNLTRPPSAEYLAHVSGLEQHEFDAALIELEHKNYIHIERTPEGLNISLMGLLSAIEREAG